ncbi:hypothetical protein PY793_11940 [Acetobacter fabarum]
MQGLVGIGPPAPVFYGQGVGLARLICALLPCAGVCTVVRAGLA